ncbi:U-box domain-containing protein 9 [Tripterygium wilfordii]|uniref:RING-type E3 ubiquitin transferase n=1 Tax=Tripterygium wilfordii TaxID=458696 RepID=A0A7J7D4Q3_TRIWF|nr:U-box domain-containing protein 9-like [Tripterygium wilfordii]KAF5741301.1 U-box domain-containing protein 9 [Tripterygium wilfordii]
MAKTGVFNSDSTAMEKVTELIKTELMKLVNSIVQDENCSVETIDQAQDKLYALKELQLCKKSLSSLKLKECPQEFRCPISKDLMKDPCVVATGQTYDRPFIQNWLKAGNRTCPRTEEVLSHIILTPNHVMRELITKWCKSQGIELPDPAQYINELPVTEHGHERFLSLLKSLSSTISEQKEAAKELRLLTKRMPSFRALFGESVEFIHQLLGPLNQIEFHPDLQEDVISTLLNVSIHEDNKKLVAEIPEVITLLMESLKSGTIETRSNAAAALFTLSAVDSNKVLIGKSGALGPLIDLLEEGYPLAMKDVASAIFSLCLLHENKARAVRDGAVRVIVKKIMNGEYVDELLAILAMLSSHRRAVEEMGELGAVPVLLSIIRESTCGMNKENSIAILHSICFNDRTKWKEVREEEKENATISKLAQDGTSRAKRKASGILERLNRAVNFTHTA